ncbi:hypothetical protein BKA61DRAFT_669780 [Leptodontidium sp. MPI-SDFR-AT-0119]|nr:hypothetical protein BKA61DRAFT_669780 [Leptodontidium sp. MPI-SDFR-AT-0119]
MATQEQTQQATVESPYNEEQDQQIVAQNSAAAAVQQPQYGAESRQYMLPPRAEGYRPAAIRESRIKDHLEVEVEVDLYARVKGDVTIGLM